MLTLPGPKDSSGLHGDDLCVGLLGDAVSSHISARVPKHEANFLFPQNHAQNLYLQIMI